ncbi:polymeric immunoglobulin receptor-like [Channa argus]|uniref:polymeric immunoglobulin receptor-like n=1 Tax=Channa argus TaxID=215402 RepID=UPI003522F443
MKIPHVLFLCFLSALCGGNNGLIILTASKGRSGRLSCYLLPSGNTKFFCKGQCEEENILIKTDNVTATSGRYSTDYKNASGYGILTVSITNFTQSDSGPYRCGLGKSLVPDSYSDFEIRVSEVYLNIIGFIRTYTEGENITYPCHNYVYNSTRFFCKEPCNRENVLITTTNVTAQTGRYGIKYTAGSASGLYVTITQVNRSDTGWYRCGYGDPLSPVSYERFQILVADGPPTTTTTPTSTPSSNAQFLPLGLGIPLVVLLLLVVFLLFYQWKKRRNTSSDKETFMMHRG